MEDERNIPAPTSSQVGVVFSSNAEAGGLIDRLTAARSIDAAGLRLHDGDLKGRSVTLAVAGAGGTSTEEATLTLIDGHRPRWLIAAGFATALSDELARGDVLLASELIDVQGEILQLSAGRQLLTPASGLSVPWRLGRLLSADRLPASPEECREILERTGAIAVESRCAAVAAACQQRRVPLVVLKIVRRAADDRLPRDVGKLRRQRTLAGKFGTALAGMVFSRPGSLKAVWSETEQDLIISSRLAECLALAIERLVPPDGEE